MKADLSRITFQPGKHYRDVIRQQGRVEVDADGNEQQAINIHRIEIETRDVVGQSGAPLHDPGFHIVNGTAGLTADEKNIPGNQITPPTPAAGDFLIGAGRYYVDGILCENEQLVLFSSQPDVPGQPPNLPNLLSAAGTSVGIVYLDVWLRHITALDDDFIREKALGGPDTATRDKVVWQVKALPWKNPPAIGVPAPPSGLHIVDPNLIHSDQLPPGSLASGVAPATSRLATAGATSFASVVEARAVPVAGTTPGVATTVARPVATTVPTIATTFVPPVVTTVPTIATTFVPPVVTTVPPIATTFVPPVVTTVPPIATTFVPPIATTVPPIVTTIPPIVHPIFVPPAVVPPPLCDAAFAALLAQVVPAKIGTLNARTQPVPPDQTLCQLPPTAGYQSLENQLYRVEIHQGSSNPNGVTFKWSRDNGVVVTGIVSVSGNTVTVQDAGPDDALGFASGQWVEILDDANDLGGTPGELFQIDVVDNSSRTISLKTVPPAVDASLNPKLRRWDQTDTVDLSAGVAVTGQWQPLENGIQVQFLQDGTYNTGDYWLIPARTATGEIEWPPFQVPNINPAAQPPRGIKHHYSCLGLVQLAADGSINVVKDCRNLFPPLTEVSATPKAIHVVGINWKNDDVFDETAFSNGLQIKLDAPLASVAADLTVPDGVIVVCIEIPFAYLIQALGARQDVLATGAFLAQGGLDLSLIIDGQSRAVGTTIFWSPPDQGLWKNVVDGLFVLGLQQIRTRVTLKGAVVWSTHNGGSVYLDGQALGQLTAGGVTDLIFPSGSGQRASDFQSWFYLGPTPVTLQTLTISPATVTLAFGVASGTATGMVTLSGAVTQDTQVALSQDHPEAVTLNSTTVTVPKGSSTASFNITVNNVGAQSVPVTVTITAQLGTAPPVSAILGVNGWNPERIE